MTDDARIRELLLINLFAVFNERDPERRLRRLTTGRPARTLMGGHGCVSVVLVSAITGTRRPRVLRVRGTRGLPGR